MKHRGAAGWSCVCMLMLLLQSGCASKIPSTLPLAEEEKPYVLNRLQVLQNRECDQSLDADITLEWQGYGKEEKIPGMLQLQNPSFLRFSVVDPMGRQLFILASDGGEFTLVNNRKAEALTGSVESVFWQKYIPGFIQPQDYLNWLTGRLEAEIFETEQVRKDKESDGGVWVIAEGRERILHHVLFSPENMTVMRHIVEGEDKEVLLDIVYSEYRSNGRTCPMPGVLQIEGAGISGTVLIHFDEIFPETGIPESHFQLAIPDHYIIDTVE